MGDKICFLRESGYSTKRLPPPSLGGCFGALFFRKKNVKMFGGGSVFLGEKNVKMFGGPFFGKKMSKETSKCHFLEVRATR